VIKPEGLAKAAGMIAVLAALATMLAVNGAPPSTQSAATVRGREMRQQRISAPADTPRSGVGAAQGRVAAAERREAGGGRAPNLSGQAPKAARQVPNSSGSRQ
jgi:hypothetical protein